MSQSSSLKVAVSLEYDRVFPGTVRPTFQELFNGIPTSVLMEIIAHFNAMIYSKEQDVSVQKEILRIWLSRLNQSIIQHVSQSIAQSITSPYGTFSFFSNQTSLVFIENAVLNYSPGESRNLTPEEEERVFKAYTLSAQKWIDEQRWEYDESIKDPEKYVRFILPIMLPFDELKEYKDFRWQIFKGLKFFSFIESHGELSKYLNLFCQKNNVENWQDYFKSIVGPFISLFQAGSKSLLLTKEIEASLNTILDELSLNVDTFERKKDFQSLREKPIYRLDKCKYLIYNYSLFVDKIFQSLIFDFCNLLKQENVVTGIPDFKNRYLSERFIEEFVFYDLMTYSIGNRKKNVSFNGNKWAAISGQKGPDYYLRCGNKIFLFELKDAYFQADAKWSYNYDVIEEELQRKLELNEKGKRKGITQLSYWINYISTKGLEFDNINLIDVEIYPILVLTDDAFNGFGVNYVMNRRFRKLLTPSGSLISKNLIIIHIDKFIELQDVLHDRKVPVQEVFRWYYEFVSKPKSIFDIYLSFSHFVSGELYQRGIKYHHMPRRFERELKKLLD